MADWDYLFVVLLLLLDEEDTSNKRIHSQYRKDFLKSLDIEQLRYSAWQKLYSAQNDQGMITLTGFDCASFASLCALFAPVFDSYTPFVPSGTSCFEQEKLPNKGRKRMICQEDGLGLVLAWTRTLMALQLI